MKPFLHYLGAALALALLCIIAWAVYTVRQALPLVGGVFLATVAVLTLSGAFLALAWGVLHLQEKHRKGKTIPLTEHGAYAYHDGAYLPLMPASVHAAPYLSPVRSSSKTRVMEVEDDDAPQKLLPAPTLPEKVRYEDVRNYVPQGHALLGVSENGVETCDFSQLMTCWIVGGSSMGKSNTVALKIDEAMRLGRNLKLLVIDPHAKKTDSLYNKIRPYEQAFLRPVAQYEDDILASLQWFLGEFKRRLDTGDCGYDLLLVVDEVSNVVESENEEIGKLLKKIARICGQESRGFGMFAFFVSQKASGLAWLRNVVITVIAHKMVMMSERKLACNEDMSIARDMESWPRGRVLVYGAGFESMRVLQQPVFTVPVLPENVASVSSRLPDTETHLNVYVTSETPINAPTEPLHVVEADVSPIAFRSFVSEREKKNDDARNEKRETIRRMKKKGMKDREIAPLVGLAGTKYPMYKELLAELHEDVPVEIESEA